MEENTTKKLGKAIFRFLFSSILLIGVTTDSNSQTTFNYTGGVQTYIVPGGVTSVTVDAYGAAGGSPGTAAMGGRMQATIAVSAGQTLNVYVGSAGTLNTGGFNGGGGVFSGTNGAFGGGGASDVRIGGTALSNRVVVAGGGGGTGAAGCCSGPAAGAGGGNTGADGTDCWANTRGFGGSQAAGGAGSGTTVWCSGSGNNGTSGNLGTGGVGGTTACCTSSSINGGGGGGGGYFGGGGSSFGGAGGGSSYTSGTVLINSQGVRAGNGTVIITPNVASATISSFTPTSGCASTTSVVITGSNFTGVTAVLFGGTNALSYTVNSTTQITTTVGSGTTGTIQVVTAGGTATSAGAFTVNALPVVSAASAASSSICAGSSTNLTATSAGNTINWWTGATGGTLLTNVASGANYSVSPSTTTTYYAEAVAPSGGTSNLINSPTHTNSGSGNYTLGYDFTPSSTITITGVRRYFGSKISIWNSAGTLLMTQVCSGTDGVWTNTACTPTVLTAGTTYRIAAYTNSGSYFWDFGALPQTFAAGTVSAGYETGGDAFPTSSDGIKWYCDLVYGGGSGCISAARTAVTVTVNALPAAPGSVTASPTTICSGGSSNLNATSTGNTINWWNAATGGTLLTNVISGTNYIVTPGATTTYYAEANTGISGSPTTQTFTYTGSVQTFTVPAGVTSVTLDVSGAQGISQNGFASGLGGRAQGTLTVSPGQVLNIYVGGQATWNGGGAGKGGANGGDASDIRVGGTALSNRVIVAGGGGGTGGDNWSCFSGTGNGGGGTAVGSNFVGGAGGSGYSFCGTNGGNFGGASSSATHGGGGGGGGFTSGGAGAASSIGTAVSGALGLGGASYNSTSCAYTGGGGGGYYGGGGAAGNNCGGGMGGGGSSWTGSLTSPSFTAGYKSGTGIVSITYTPYISGCVSTTRVPVTVTVNTYPVITVQPSAPSAMCSAVGTATVTVTATGATTYQWQKGGVNISGAPYSGFNSNTLTITSPGTGENGAVLTCIVGNGTGCNTTSNAVTLAVNTSAAAPSPVTASPGTLCAGSTSQLNATASNAINWWTAATGGSLVGTSASTVNFPVTPGVTTTYYAETQGTAGATGSQTFNYSGTIANFTVPAGVTSLTIDAYGAQGGSGTIYATSLIGGKGARMMGTVAVTPGEILKVLVGQMGGSSGGPHGNENGGGGGSFVVRQTGNVPLVIAGGGGGAPSTSYGTSCTRVAATADGQITTSGVTVGCSATANGGTGGNGGSAAGSYEGGAGGGFYTDGANGGTHCSLAYGGLSFLNGGTGGAGNTCYNTNNYGGFGGGGGGMLGGPGGGGGYSGGASAGSWSSFSTYGGGGGSYNSGTSQTNVSGLQTGNGQVIISWNLPAGCPSSTRPSVTVTVNPAPVITVQPTAPAGICSGAGVATISITATNATGYQWKKNGVALTNTAPYSGVNTSTLTITNPNSSEDGSYITCAVTNGVCAAVTSTSVIITVNRGPALSSSESPSTAVCNGTAVTLSGSTTNNLVAYYQFEEAAGTTTADISGNNLTATFQSTALWTGSSAPVAGTADAVYVNNGYLSVADNAVINTLQNNLTIEAYIYQFDNTNNTIVDRGNYNFLFQACPNGQTGLGFYNPNGGWTYSAGVIPVNQWTHVAVTWNGTTGVLTFYMNGSVLSTHSRPTPLAFNAGPMNIGRQEPNSCQCNTMTGIIDELKLWSTVRTQAEITGNMGTEMLPRVSSYSWLPSTGLNTTSGASVTATPSSTTTYTVTGTSAAGCTSISTQTVNILANYNIVASAGANGSISPNGTTAVCSGTNQAYTITPNGGYHILDVLVDGVSNAGAIGSGAFTFTNVTATHTISVTFAPNCTIPVITPPSNITVSNSAGMCGAIVNYTATITGSPTPTVTYSQNSGTTFSIGTTTVTITASNTCGTVTSTFTVTVNDTEVPVINTHANITQSNDAGMCSAVVTFTAPTATDNCSVSSVVCTPASGSTFAAGTTTVNCVATDSHGNTASTSFTVTVNDTEAPVISGNSATANSGDDATGDCAFTSGSVGANVGSYTITGDNCSSSFTVQENFFFNGNPDGTATWTLGAGTWFPVHTYQVGVTTVNVTVTDAAGNTSTTSYTQTVVDNELPTITAPADVTVCNGASIALGTPTTGDNCGVATLINNAPGSYSVGTTVVTWTVTDIHGNTATATQNVIVNALPDATIVSSNSFHIDCNVPQEVLYPTNTSYGCVWTVGGNFWGTFAFGIAAPLSGTWGLTVTDGNGCTASSTAVITENFVAPDATISASNGLTFCDGNSTVLSVPVTGTTSQVWNQNGVFFATASNPLVTVGAMYDVTVTDATNGCTASSSVTTVANPLPIGSASNIVICNGDPSNVPLNSTEANTTYAWTSPVTTGGVIGNNDCASGCGNAIADVLTNTGYVHGVVTYTVIPTSGLGCTGAPFTANVTVGAAPAAPVISGPNALCGLTSTFYTVAAVPEATSYVWTVPTGVTGMTITGGQGTTTLHVSISAGTVSGDVTCTAYNNCGSSVTTTFAVTKKPAVPGAITGPTSTCGQTTATYSIAPVFGATSYIWTLPSGMTGTSSTNTITVTIAGTFVYGQLKVSAVNACGNVLGTGIWITGNAPTIPLTLSGPANVCGLTTGTYSIPAVAGASGYNWTITGVGNSISGSNTGTTATAVLAGPGTISVAATNLCGSSPYRALTLVTTAVQPGAISGPLNTCGLTTATYSVAPVANAATYTWSLAYGMTWGSGQGTNVINVNIAPGLTSNTVTSPLKLTETNTCGNTSLFRTTTITRCLSPDAMNAEGGSTFTNVYPNPTSSEFTMDVTMDRDQEIVMEVFDILGNVVISEKHNLVSGTSTMKTSLEQFNSGIYFVRILDANSNVLHTERVVKQ